MAVPASFKSKVAITHITTATAILEFDGVTFITDPSFDDAPQDYDLSHLAGMKPGELVLSATEGPKLSIKQLPVIDAVLLSHEDHVDNLDQTGRQLLLGRHVITTPDGARNLCEYPGVSAIQPWQTLGFRFGGEEWKVTGTPCVHVPGGEVTGFLLHKDSFGLQPDGRPNVFYFTGDNYNPIGRGSREDEKAVPCSGCPCKPRAGHVSGPKQSHGTLTDHNGGKTL